MGGYQEYYYWSDRWIRKILEDNAIKINAPGQIKFGTPAWLNAAGKAEYTKPENAKSKNEISKVVFDSLGDRIVKDVGGSPSPVGFACGVGPVKFGQFRSTRRYGVPLKGIVHPCEDDCPSSEVAICLFGSLENFEGFTADSVSRVTPGWSISTAPGIQHFLSHYELDGSVLRSLEELGEEAAKVATCYGIKENILHANERVYEFHFGHADPVCEWCAIIFADTCVPEHTFTNYSRVLVGAPLWVRSPSRRGMEIHRADQKEADERGREGSRLQRSLRSRLKAAIAAFKKSS